MTGIGEGVGNREGVGVLVGLGVGVRVGVTVSVGVIERVGEGVIVGVGVGDTKAGLLPVMIKNSDTGNTDQPMRIKSCLRNSSIFYLWISSR